MFKKFLTITAICFLALLAHKSAFAFDMPFGMQEGHVMPDEEVYNGASDKGSRTILGVIMMGVDYIRAIVGAVIVLWMVWSGIMMITSGGDEDQFGSAKTGLVWGAVSLGLVLMVEPMITNVLYGGGSMGLGETLKDSDSMKFSIQEGTKQIMGYIEWLKALLVTIAIAFLIFSGFRMVAAFGDTDQIDTQKKVVLWVVVGFIVISLNDVIINQVVYRRFLGIDGKVVFDQDPVRGIEEFVGVVKFLLKFLAMAAFAVMVYGGLQVILGAQDEERAENGKKTIFSALIGIIIITISFAVLSTIFSAK
ncbi:MAG: hypothetical protein N4A36_03860 [Candidatus Gracilibacteria bacterium]|jgi:hypothetical protein|nr:hypothetical protein [Candidatus Gracilibacteria bacterium]